MVNERFNRMLQDEFLSLRNMTVNTTEFNHQLTEWLIEYNLQRPQQTLNLFESHIRILLVMSHYALSACKDISLVLAYPYDSSITTRHIHTV